MRRTLAAAAVVVLLAACSPGGHPAVTRTVTTAPGPPGPPAGPFRITPLYCGKFSRAQENTYADVSGYLFRYTDVSRTVTGAPDLSVNFTEGSTVAGQNVNGALPLVHPGQSAVGEVGAVGGYNDLLRFDACQPLSYVVSTGSGRVPGTYFVPASASRTAAP